MNERYRKYEPTGSSDVQQFGVYSQIITKDNNEDKLTIAIQPHLRRTEKNIQTLRFTFIRNLGLTRVEVKPHNLLNHIFVHAGGQANGARFLGELSLDTIDAFDNVSHYIIARLIEDGAPTEIITCCRDMFQCPENFCINTINRELSIWGYVREFENQTSFRTNPIYQHGIPTSIKGLIQTFSFSIHQEGIPRKMQSAPHQSQEAKHDDEQKDETSRITPKEINYQDQSGSRQTQSRSIFTPQRVFVAGIILMIGTFYLIKRRRQDNQSQDDMSQDKNVSSTQPKK